MKTVKCTDCDCKDLFWQIYCHFPYGCRLHVQSQQQIIIIIVIIISRLIVTSGVHWIDYLLNVFPSNFIRLLVNKTTLCDEKNKTQQTKKPLLYLQKIGGLKARGWLAGPAYNPPII